MTKEYKRLFQYAGLYVLLLILTLFLFPHGDDWTLMRYINNHQNWSINSFQWYHGHMFLPRDYWRPEEDLLGLFMRRFPTMIPAINHILISFMHVACGFMVYKLCIKIKIKEFVSFYVSLFFIFATTSMGVLLSVDSFAQALVTFWGLMSILVYISKIKYKYLLWLLLGYMATFGKESGCVFFIAAPVFDLLYSFRSFGRRITFSTIQYRPFFIKLGLSFIPAILYLIIYFYLGSGALKGTIKGYETVIENNSLSNITDLNISNGSYNLTVAGFIRNFFVLYIAPVFPIDTSAVYYKNYFLLGITILFSFIFLVFFIKKVFHYVRNNFTEFIIIVSLIVGTSLVALLTRAGEMSPHNNLPFIAVLIGLIFNNYKFSKKTVVFIIPFILATLITDIHKYSLAYRAGMNAKNFGIKIVKESPVNPDKVLLVIFDDFSFKKSGAFIPVPGQDFTRGASIIAEYKYKYPKKLDKISIRDKGFSYNEINDKLDEIKEKNKGNYDCIWVYFRGDINVLK